MLGQGYFRIGQVDKIGIRTEYADVLFVALQITRQAHFGRAGAKDKNEGHKENQQTTEAHIQSFFHTDYASLSSAFGH
jgi:hypothetical protein